MTQKQNKLQITKFPGWGLVFKTVFAKINWRMREREERREREKSAPYWTRRINSRIPWRDGVCIHCAPSVLLTGTNPGTTDEPYYSMCQPVSLGLLRRPSLLSLSTLSTPNVQAAFTPRLQLSPVLLSWIHYVITIHPSIVIRWFCSGYRCGEHSWSSLLHQRGVCMYVRVLLTCNWSFEFSIDYAAHGASRLDNRRAVDFASMARLTANGSLCPS